MNQKQKHKNKLDVVISRKKIRPYSKLEQILLPPFRNKLSNNNSRNIIFIGFARDRGIR